MFVRAYIHPAVTKSPLDRIGTTFWNVCEGTVKFNCSETDQLRSGEGTTRDLFKTNYVKFAYCDVESERIVGCSAQ